MKITRAFRIIAAAKTVAAIAEAIRENDNVYDGGLSGKPNLTSVILILTAAESELLEVDWPSDILPTEDELAEYEKTFPGP